MKNGFTGFLKKFFINIAAMAAVVVAICYFTLAWLDDYTLHGQVIDVPDVCGMNIDEAGTLLRDAKLDYEVVDYKYKKGARENDVVEQQPLHGSQAYRPP